MTAVLPEEHARKSAARPGQPDSDDLQAARRPALKKKRKI
jgi:hypothetical protein